MLFYGHCHTQVPWPDHECQQGLPPDELEETDGEHPADHPEDAAGSACIDFDFVVMDLFRHDKTSSDR